MSHPLLWWQLCRPLAFSQWASPGRHLKCFSLMCLVKDNMWNVLHSQMGLLCCAEVRVVPCWQPYMTTLWISIVAVVIWCLKGSNSWSLLEELKFHQSRKLQKLWMDSQVQLRKHWSAAKKMAHIQTTSAKEDQESPLLQKNKFIGVTNLTNHKLRAPEIRGQINATIVSSKGHISTSTVHRRWRKSPVMVK